MRRLARLEHQREIMGIILCEMGQGRELTAAEIYPMLSYASEVTLCAVRKTIELLEKNELVVRERRGRNMDVIPTERGYDWFRPARPPSAGRFLEISTGAGLIGRRQSKIGKILILVPSYFKHLLMSSYYRFEGRRIR